MLYLTGYKQPTIEDIENFRQLGSPMRRASRKLRNAGIEVTTGPLGQGVANAVGMAIAERHLNASTATIWSTITLGASPATAA